MTLDPGTSAVGQLRSHLATSLNGDRPGTWHCPA
jgi:hypothetical protein